jgi:tetratricopeptide (TPR) repeat protein
MTRPILNKILLATALAAATLAAQTANTSQPKPKGPKEVEAIQAVFAAQDPDTRIAAVEKLVTKFSDTEFKAYALYAAASSYQQKNDMENVVVFAEKCLEADPKFFGAQLMIANALAVRTKEFDLDREEKLGRVEKLAKEALALIAGAAKPRPEITDEQWAAAKKDFSAQAYEALGLAAMPRKKWDVCVQQLTLAISNATQPDPATMVRLASCQIELKKYDDAIATLDKALADANAAPQVKNVATSMKIQANKAKAAAAAK